MRTIAHVYQTYAEASRIVQALESAGIPHSDISIVSGDRSVGNTGYDDLGTGTSGTSTTGTSTMGTSSTGTSSTGVTSGDPEQGAATGAGTGATIGTVLGGGAGLLAGIGALAIPGLGPIVAAGWLVAALTGAGVGAAAGGLLGSLTGAGISEADARTYQEHVNSGGTLVTVRCDDAQAAHVEQIMGQSTGYAGMTGPSTYEHAGTLGTGSTAIGAAAGMASTGSMSDVGTTTNTGTGYTGTAASMSTTDRTAYNTTATTGTTAATGAMDTGDAIKVVKEDVAVGKRAVEAGGVRVTSHVVETPVEEQVRLQQERVTIERHPVNQPVSGTDAFREQTIEARATEEIPVVAKEARVVEEIGVRKEATERVETVRDTVRETKVDVENVTPTTTTSTTTTNTTTSGTTGTTRKV